MWYLLTQYMYCLGLMKYLGEISQKRRYKLCNLAYTDDQVAVLR